MKHKYLILFFLTLSLCIFTACGAQTAVSEADAAAETPAAVPESGDWEPKLEVETFSDSGATVIFRQTHEDPDLLVLCGNDYILEEYTDDGWKPLPMLTQNVNWVENAFVVTAIPRDEIDWQWLYGQLPGGHYRIGKTVTLHMNGENAATTLVYGEFTLKKPLEPTEAVYDASDPETSVYDASAAASADEVYTYVPMSELPAGYRWEEAERDHVVVMRAGNQTRNTQVWQSFLNNTAAGRSVSVRCMRTGFGDGTDRLYDVSYDGFLYTVRWLENGREESLVFKQLLCYPEDAYEIPDATLRYVLTMDADVTWEDIQWGMVSENEYDRVPHMVVYQQAFTHSASPNIPYSPKVDLSLRGKTLISSDGDTARQLVALMRQATVLHEKPDIYYMGLDLIFYGEDGTQTTLWLDLHGDHFLLDGTFYRYSTDELLKILQIDTWPEEVLFAFPEDLHP